MNVNYLKALVASLAIVGVCVMASLGKLSGESATLMIGTVVGYVLGNGVNAAKGQDVPGILRPKPEGRRATDRLPPPALDELD